MVEAQAQAYDGVKSILAGSSGLPKGAPTACHIEAIQKKAVEDYFKNRKILKL